MTPFNGDSSHAADALAVLSEAGRSRIETEQHTASQFEVACLGANMLRRRVDVAKAALQRSALEQCSPARGVEQQIDGFRRRFRCLCGGEPGDGALVQRRKSPRGGLGPYLFDRVVQEGAAGTEQRFGASDGDL